MPQHQSDFWREMVEPHADEVNDIVVKARDLMARPDGNLDTDWAADTRAKFYRDAKNLLGYARKLAPQNVEVLALLGRAADELGETKEALEALEACVRIAGDKAPIDALGRLGTIQLRLGNNDAAFRWLRIAQAPLSTVSVPYLVALANLYATRGDIAKGIDTLETVIPAALLGDMQGDAVLATFALAVLYDRDEQRSAAFKTVDSLQANKTTGYGAAVQAELAHLRLANPEDIFYYRAFLYESLGEYTEARTEWSHFAAIDSPWRGRALDHIARIDAQRRAKPGPVTAPDIITNNPLNNPPPPPPPRRPTP